MRSVFIIIFLSLIVIARSIGQEATNVMKVNGQIHFDGFINEPAWNTIPLLKMEMQVPDFGQPPTEEAAVRLTYDDQYLYLSASITLSDSSYYRGTTFKRDAMDGTTDYFGFMVDSYNDNENGLGFFTSGTALRFDASIANDAQTETSMSLDWNTFWDAATQKTAHGWDVEMRVPWTSLRFQDQDGEVIMGITVWLYLSAKNEVVMCPLIPLNWGDMSMWKPSQARKYRFRGIYGKKPLYLTPYALTGYQVTNELNEKTQMYDRDEDPKLEAGLDLKYSLTSNLTIDLTANTDFAQVEADDQQVNLTRFSLFFPEKRQFFQERASIFDYSFDNFNRLFYSRKIGINDDGDPVRIYGGARLQGRLKKFDVGFLSMQTEAPETGLFSENFTVLRARRQSINPYSYLGAIFTNRMNFKGRYNSSYGLDGIIRVTQDDYLTAKWVQSFENGKSNNVFSLDPARIYIQWEKRRFDGFAYQLAFSRAGKDWSPAMGFEERESFSSWQGELSYGWLMGENSKLLRFRVFQKGYNVQNYLTNKLQTRQFETGFELHTKNGWFVSGSFLPSKEYVSESFELGDVEIPVGDYQFSQFTLNYFTPFASLLGIFGGGSIGQFYDGTLTSISLAPRYKISAHFNLEGFYQYNKAIFDERSATFESHLARVKLEYLANTRFSIAAFLQYNSFDDVFVPNVRLRYNPKEGNDLYIVFNDLLHHDRTREIPHLPSSESRVVVVKYTYTFIL